MRRFLFLLLFFSLPALPTSDPEFIEKKAPGNEMLYSRPGAPPQLMQFKEHGKLVRTMALAEMYEVVPKQEIPVLDPYQNTVLIYKGFSLQSLLYHVFQEGWRKWEQIVLTQQGGGRFWFPVAKLIHYNAYLAYARPPVSEFALARPSTQGKLELAPFYLIWDNQKDPQLKESGDKDWGVQIVSLDLVNLTDLYPRSYPAVAAPQRRGFTEYRQYCSSCHTVNGEGEGRAIDLNYPVSVTEYIKEEWLKRWILDPQSIRPRVDMPPLRPVGDNDAKDGIAVSIVAYLKAIAKDKRYTLPRSP